MDFLEAKLLRHQHTRQLACALKYTGYNLRFYCLIHRVQRFTSRKMSIVDDPMLALIMRFISKEKHLDISDEAFLQLQLVEIKNYVAQYPQEQETKRTMEWIEQYAENYRKDWQKNMAVQQSSRRRCPDCPLRENGNASYCEIHNQWQELLKNYIDNKINSKTYVEDTLHLLEEHKADLKISLSSKRILEGGC